MSANNNVREEIFLKKKKVTVTLYVNDLTVYLRGSGYSSKTCLSSCLVSDLISVPICVPKSIREKEEETKGEGIDATSCVL